MHLRAEHLLVLAAMHALAGCVSAPSGNASTPATPAAVEPTAASPVPAAGETPAKSQEPVISERSPLDEVLAERRRGDYPQIETDDVGFTISEQVRIGSDARDRYQRAMVLLGQERYAEGIALLVQVTELAADVTTPYVDLAIAYSRIGDIESARETLETAARLSPDHPLVQNELGIVYRSIGRFDAARTSYEKALAVYSGFHFARRNLAVLCDLYLADLSCAIENYRAYLNAVGDDPDVEIWLADLENRLAQQGGS